MTDRNLGGQSNKKVDVYLEFRNDKQYGLGVPLPAGRIRVSQLDAADGTLEFIGEDRIDHTPKDETGPREARLGVRCGGRAQADRLHRRHQSDNGWKSRFEIKLRNHKDQPVDVLVKENLYRWSNWKILTKTHEFTKEDARTIHFPGGGAEGWGDYRPLPGSLHLVTERGSAVGKTAPTSELRHILSVG